MKEILLPEINSPAIAEYAQRSPEGVRFDDLSIEQSIELLKAGEVGGVIVGADHTSADVIRAGIKLLGTVDGLVSSFFIMKKEGHDPIFFADCAVNPDPDEEKLCKIAEQTAESVRKLGYSASVAFLSFSTDGSAGHTPQAQKVRSATRLFQERNPGVEAIGEVQFDAAWDDRIYEKKTGQIMIEKPKILS